MAPVWARWLRLCSACRGKQSLQLCPSNCTTLFRRQSSRRTNLRQRYIDRGVRHAHWVWVPILCRHSPRLEAVRVTSSPHRPEESALSLCPAFGHFSFHWRPLFNTIDQQVDRCQRSCRRSNGGRRRHCLIRCVFSLGHSDAHFLHRKEEPLTTNAGLWTSDLNARRKSTAIFAAFEVVKRAPLLFAKLSDYILRNSVRTNRCCFSRKASFH